MRTGCIPVIVATDFVKPFAEEIDWSTFSFTFSPDEAPDMVRTLRSVSPEELRQMQVTRAVTSGNKRDWKQLVLGAQGRLVSGSTVF